MEMVVISNFSKLKFFLIFGIGVSIVFTHTLSKTNKKKVYQYRKNQVVDFSGSTISGKIRTPEIFYIFKRKRSTGQDFVLAPDDLSHQHSKTWDLLKKVIH